MTTLKLTKLALKRDDSVPVGQPAPMHLDCPCGAKVDVISDLNVCSCGAKYDGLGWVVAR